MRKSPEQLQKRFYTGINLKRGTRAYLYFDGKQTTRESVLAFAKILGGSSGGPYYQNRNWNYLQILLSQLGILVSTNDISVYDWNEAIPWEFKEALRLKDEGKSTEDILSLLFPTYLDRD